MNQAFAAVPVDGRKAGRNGLFCKYPHSGVSHHWPIIPNKPNSVQGSTTQKRRILGFSPYCATSKTIVVLFHAVKMSCCSWCIPILFFRCILSRVGVLHSCSGHNTLSPCGQSKNGLFPCIATLALDLWNKSSKGLPKHTLLSTGLGLITTGMISPWWCFLVVVAAIPKAGLMALLLIIPITTLSLFLGFLISSLISWCEYEVEKQNLIHK